MTLPRSARVLLRLSLAVAVLHIVFGAIVRISGSGMGCGDNWPRCQGAWFPPMSQPTLVIEWTHRLLAAVVLATIALTAAMVWRARDADGVRGPGGIGRPVMLALGLVVTTAAFGAVTVWLANAPLATVGHWTLAAALLATLLTALVRAGDLGGDIDGLGTAKLYRASVAAAGLTLAVLIFGGLTAKVPGANSVCPQFPLCGATAAGPEVSPLVLIQGTHRVLAFFLFFHLLGITIANRKLRTAPAARRALQVAFALVLTQVLVAGAMIGMHLPPRLRSLHQGVGVFLWMAVVVLVLLARRAAPRGEAEAPSIAVIIARGGGA